MMIQEVELWKQEIELLSDQSEISNVVILNHKAKLVSFSTTVHKATHSSVALLKTNSKFSGNFKAQCSCFICSLMVETCPSLN